ncbi:MAG: tetratricopeptide repeat protein [Desulfobacterales bacterium]|nr:tetratricopeptide repeat protein [Desulfobacterales bacterium]
MTEKKTPSNAAEWFEEGRMYFSKPDGVAAVAAMERVIDLEPLYRHPDGDNPYFYLGKIHEVEGRTESAVFYYTRALAVNPVDEESLIGRGSCYTVGKQHVEAIADFMKVLQFPDEHRRVPKGHLFYAIAENFRQMNVWEKSREWGEKALAADPENTRHQDLLKEVSAKIKPPHKQS